MSASSLIQFENVTKSFGPLTAVDAVSLGVAQGEFFSLLGPSGCGKTTLLRMLAGFEQPQSGRIWLGGEDITALPPHRRPVNMMFQSYALFPHMSVEKNIAFGLVQEGVAKREIAGRVSDMLALVQLDGLGARRPDQLSGGQRQRVALARALIKRPKALLLDEPLAALDRKLREETQLRLKAIQKELAMTFFIVTHDQDEALTLSDRIAVMNRGQIVQVGTPHDLYHRPRSVTAASFVGDMNLMAAQMLDADMQSARLQTADGIFTALFAAPPGPPGAMRLGVRPEHVRFARNAPAAAPENSLEANVQAVFFRGDATLCVARSLSGQEWRSLAPAGESAAELPAQGERIWLSFSRQHALALPDEGAP